MDSDEEEMKAMRGSKRTILILLWVLRLYVPYYTGMACTGLLHFFGKFKTRGNSAQVQGPGSFSWPQLASCSGVALFGISAQSLNWTGNMLAGSSVFAVVYASVTIWSAVLSWLLLQRVLTLWQWLSIIAVFAGLAVTGVDARSTGDCIFLGTCMIGAGTILHATCHVLSEMLSVRGSRIPAHLNASIQGLTGCAVVGVWQLAFTASHWQRISEPMEEIGTSWLQASLLLSSVALGNFVHAGTFFYLLTRVGAVSTGMAKALQGVVVFALSHVLYCRQDESQCFSLAKGLSLLIVTAGVVSYVLATSSAKSSAKQTSS
ncbi:unnamed protein product [Symbiodinium natans]|uniref:Sugar phosphate transporter domain-containing protein n=1 Tax=Symbiodinium natans TaxID=878477 RepID=A0A812SLY0_9DINO|nr:unnamed protein product [Symbiodinium natans]